MAKNNPLTMEEKGQLKGWANAQYAISRRYKDIDPTRSEFYHGRSVAAGKIASTYNPALHSSRSHSEDVMDVVRGTKPAALVDSHAAELASKYFLIILKVPNGLFGSVLSSKLGYVVAGTRPMALRVIQVLEKYPMPRGPEYHKAMGRALGYSERDIQHFLRKFYSTNPGSIQQVRSGMKVYCSVCGKMILTRYYLYKKGELYHLHCYRGKFPGEKNPMVSKDPWEITLGQVENAIAYAWRCFDRYEEHNDPYDKKGTELYLKFQKAKEVAEGLKFHAPWLYPTGLPNPTLVMPIKSKKQLGHMFKAQSHLSKAGVGFDSGTSIKGGKPSERHWELDWSLRGGRMRNPLGKRQREVLSLMQSGWELGETEGFTPRAWLQKGGIAKGGETKEVSMGLLISLYKKELIEIRAKKYPFVYYKMSRTPNPIRHTKQGWYWGSVGPQPTKKKLMAQVGAIYAGGYKGRNPAGLYQAFHGAPSKGTRKVFYETPNGPLIKIGRLANIEYIPEPPSKHVGTRFTHEAGDLGHKVIKSNAILATNKAGTQLYIVRENKSTKYPRFSKRGILG